MNSSRRRLSRTRTFLFGALACVWFAEMMLWGFPSLTRIWSQLWQVAVPGDSQLLTTLYIARASESPAKGALFVMAILGLRSKSPSVRAALFASMSLVPPLNIAFPFRQQGFLPGPVTVAAVFSAILWGSFFFVPEPAGRPEREDSRGPGPLPASQWETAQRVWFTTYSVAVTLLALLFLFWPGEALRLTIPSVTKLLDAPEGDLAGVIHSAMASGTHLAAVATASWVATVRFRSHPDLRKAVALGCAVHAGLFVVFPLRQIFLGFGGAGAMSSILIGFVPLFVGWLLYGFVETTRTRPSAALET